MKRFLRGLILASAVAQGGFGVDAITPQPATAQMTEINQTALNACVEDEGWYFVAPSHCYRFYQTSDATVIAIITLTYDNHVVAQEITVAAGAPVILSEIEVRNMQNEIVAQSIVDVEHGTAISGEGDWDLFHEDAWKARQMVAEFSGYYSIY